MTSKSLINLATNKERKRFVSQKNLLIEIVNTYRRFDWRLRRLLLRPEILNELAQAGFDLERELALPNDLIEAGEVDAAWFARPTQAGGEAWELRLIAAERFALFETFELDEAEEEREDVRREMQARLRDRTLKIRNDDFELNDELALDE